MQIKSITEDYVSALRHEIALLGFHGRGFLIKHEIHHFVRVASLQPNYTFSLQDISDFSEGKFWIQMMKRNSESKLIVRRV